jgi:hypothetical protein
MTKLSFVQRYGGPDRKLIDNEFPMTARNGLIYILEQFAEEGCIKKRKDNPWGSILLELLRTSKSEFSNVGPHVDASDRLPALSVMQWQLVYAFCERIHDNLLMQREIYLGDGDWRLDETLEKVRERFTAEINALLSEENMAYVFADGVFNRPGRPQTQRNIIRAQAILADPRLLSAKQHFVKAQDFFSARPPDYENTVKEAVCALEATIEIRSGKRVSKDFSGEMERLSGNAANKIPAPIAQAMIKLHAYRGAAKAVAHANTTGLNVSKYDAELVLSTSAAWITYASDFFDSIEPDFPF